MGEILDDFSTPALAAAVEVGHAEFFAHLGRSPQGEIHDSPEFLRVITRLPHPIFNGVFRAQLPSTATETTTEAVLAPFQVRRIPMFWWIGPMTRPHDLGARLETFGLTHAGTMPGMAIDLHALNKELPVLPGLSIEPVRTREALKEWGQVTNRSFEIPESIDDPWLEFFASAGLDLPLRYYLGRLNGQPVTSSCLLLGAGVAGIYAVATLPASRQQGLGAAITLDPLLDAREMGYRIGILSASPLGFSVYRRLGFQECGKLSVYRWLPGPDETEGETDSTAS